MQECVTVRDCQLRPEWPGGGKGCWEGGREKEKGEMEAMRVVFQRQRQQLFQNTCRSKP